MAISDDLKGDVNDALNFTWSLRDGQIVPSTADVALTGGGVKLEVTMLYADLADSTRLAMWDRRITARAYKAFLSASSRLIKWMGGSVRSFDGDRVMGVFIGNTKNTDAVKCALHINWMFSHLLRPGFENKYEKIRDGTYRLAHACGIDTSDVLVVRGGVRNDNDLLWVGRAPNIAAKLSGLRDGNYFTWITGDVYDKLMDRSKLANGKNMWEERNWTNQPVTRIFRSSYHWKP